MLDKEKLKSISVIVKDTLHSADGGELFLENKVSEEILMQDSIIRNNSFSQTKGFGFRAFYDDKTVFVHSSDVAKENILKASEFIKSNELSENYDNLERCNALKQEENSDSLYSNENIIDENNFPFEKKINFLKEIYEYTFSQNDKIKKVTVKLSGEFQEVTIINRFGNIVTDLRPLCRLDVIVLASENDEFEQGYAAKGGRFSYNELFKNWQVLVHKAIKQAETNLQAIAAPAGEFTVVLGNGWPGILLHEAIGHGLEADFNRKKTSAFSDLMGEQIASDVVTVVDDGTYRNRRGSINIDDEGTKTTYNVLIKDGILVNYIYDSMNAKIMHKQSTGNGRRESYAHHPMPRMTNTYMLSGSQSPEDIISSVKKGIYAVSFGGGQVDITSGKFVFSSSESYLIEDGKITKPIKGATFVGNGPDILKQISMVGNDLELDSGIGTCGKDGQSVPVGVGQPTIKIEKITVGGTDS
jgi:TldD protein